MEIDDDDLGNFLSGVILYVSTEHGVEANQETVGGEQGLDRWLV